MGAAEEQGTEEPWGRRRNRRGREQAGGAAEVEERPSLAYHSGAPAPLSSRPPRRPPASIHPSPLPSAPLSSPLPPPAAGAFSLGSGARVGTE